MTNELKLLPIISEMKLKIDNWDVLTDRTGVKYVELLAPRIELDPKQRLLNFGVRKTPQKYIESELIWYDSEDLSVKYISEHARMWSDISSEKGYVNSNYGYLVYSDENYSQFENVLTELIANKDSRRGLMIYIRPSMWNDYKVDGMNDFICTLGVQYMIRNDELISIVNMRSNDIIYGFFNDYYWQATVHGRMYNALKTNGYDNLKYGKLIWVANSLHVYEKHFKLIQGMYKFLVEKEE